VTPPASRLATRGPFGRLLRWPLRWISPRTVVPVLRGPLRGARWIVGASSHGCWLGSYERENQLLFAQLLRAGDVVVDAGAHVGFFSLLAARLVGPTGSVLAFEPMPASRALLERHCALNRMARIDVSPMALADVAGPRRMSAAHALSCAHFSPSGEVEVSCETLDRALEARGVPPLRLIKLDVEGAEDAVLAGAARTLQRQPRPALLIATHGWEAHEACLRRLRALGFERLEHEIDEVSGNGRIIYGFTG
jgi:FkbM family methyltransferase